MDEEATRERPLADRDVRLLAVMLDRGVFALPVGLVVLGYSTVDPIEIVAGSAQQIGNLVQWISMLGLFVTQAVLITVRGQSLGKIVAGIRIERPDGSLPGFLRAVLLRAWVFNALALCGIVPLVDALMIFSSERRTLHDLLADTRVVRVEGGWL